MAINLTDSLNAATTKGKLGEAKQVFLNGDTKNLQQAHEETNIHLDTLDNRSTQMENAIKDISATGGASVASAVSYDNSTSKLEAVTAQGAIDELKINIKQEDEKLNAAIEAETTRAQSRENDLVTVIENEVDRATSAEIENTALINQEISRIEIKDGYYISLEGNDNNTVFGNVIDIRGVSSIIIAPQTRTWSCENVTSAMLFVQKSENGKSLWDSISGFGEPSGAVLRNFYEIIPDGTYNYIRLAVRADIGQTAIFNVTAKNSIAHQYLEFKDDYEQLFTKEQTAFGCVIPTDKSIAKTYILAAGNKALNERIEKLHTDGGGVIKLYNGWNTSGVPIEMKYDDVVIIGEDAKHVKISTIPKEGSIIVGDGITARVSNITFNAMYKCNKNSSLILDNVIIEHPLAFIGTNIYNGKAPSVYYLCSSDSSNKPWFFEEISTDSDAGAVINQALNNFEEVYLATGTYNTSTTIRLNSNNKLAAASVNYRSTINRQQAGNYCIMTNANAVDTTVQNLNCNSFIRLDKNNSYNGHIINCVFNSKYIATDVYVAQKGVNVIKLGDNYNKNLTMKGIVELLTYPDRTVYSDNEVKYRIEVYGLCMETNTMSVNILDTMEIEGMTDDAELGFVNNSNQSALIFYDRDGEQNHSVVKNLKLSMYGTYGGWQYAVLYAGGNWLTFENLEIRNRQDCATPRTADEINSAPNSVTDGDRKHGVLVSTNYYGNDCHTVFRNVKAYGSPYGFKNCRGFYIVRGSAKFYNCIGVGGGFGRYGYGWVCHHASKPYLYNCIGIGSPYGWGLNNGIQFQMATEAHLFNCIGIGSTGKQRYSNGNKDIVTLSSLSEASHGYCCYMAVHPTLMNCAGYAADVDGSCGFVAGYDSKPHIEGGYYGKETKIICNKVSFSEGDTVKTVDVGNLIIPVELQGLGFRDTLVDMPSGQKVVVKVNGTVICEATEAVQQQYPEISNVFVPAYASVTCELVNSDGSEATGSSISFNLIVRYKSDNKMDGLYVETSASPRIHHATFGGNSKANGLNINCPSSADYIIDNCTIDINPDMYSVKSNSPNEVKVYNCVMRSSNFNNATFAKTQASGSNIIVV